MPNLLAQGGFGCVYYPALSKQTGQWTRRKFVTKIQRNDSSAANEVYIGKRIMVYPKYALFFLPVLSSWKMRISPRNDRDFKDCDAIGPDTTNYRAMTIKYIEGADLSATINRVTIKRKVLILMETFRYLLFALEALGGLNIVHFDLKFGNVLFTRLTDEPRIADFGISLHNPEALVFGSRDSGKDDTLDKLKHHFYIYTVEYPVWCLDIIVLSWIADRRSWKAGDAREIMDAIKKSSKLTSSLPPKVARKWRKQTQAQLNKYSKMRIYDLADYLLLQWTTWDTYSLAMMYFEVGTTLKVGAKRGDAWNSVFMTKWETLLTQNISPDPNQRLAPADTRKQFDDMFLMWDTPEVYAAVAQELGGGAKFRMGQPVRITKRGSQYGYEAGVLDADWNGLVKVAIRTGPSAGDTKSYAAGDLDPISQN